MSGIISYIDVVLYFFTEVQSGECPVPSLLISRCVEQCSTDSDCSVKQKCCDNGCGHSCENSTTCKYKEKHELFLVKAISLLFLSLNNHHICVCAYFIHPSKITNKETS